MDYALRQKLLPGYESQLHRDLQDKRASKKRTRKERLSSCFVREWVDSWKDFPVIHIGTRHFKVHPEDSDGLDRGFYGQFFLLELEGGRRIYSSNLHETRPMRTATDWSGTRGRGMRDMRTRSFLSSDEARDKTNKTVESKQATRKGKEGSGHDETYAKVAAFMKEKRRKSDENAERRQQGEHDDDHGDAAAVGDDDDVDDDDDDGDGGDDDDDDDEEEEVEEEEEEEDNGRVTVVKGWFLVFDEEDSERHTHTGAEADVEEGGTRTTDVPSLGIESTLLQERIREVLPCVTYEGLTKLERASVHKVQSSLHMFFGSSNQGDGRAQDDKGPSSTPDDDDDNDDDDEDEDDDEEEEDSINFDVSGGKRRKRVAKHKKRMSALEIIRAKRKKAR